MKRHVGFVASAVVVLAAVALAGTGKPFALPATLAGLAITVGARVTRQNGIALLALAATSVIGLAGVTIEQVASPGAILLAGGASIAIVNMVDVILVDKRGGERSSLIPGWGAATTWTGITLLVFVALYAWDLTAGYLRGPHALEIGVMGAVICCAGGIAFTGLDDGDSEG